MSSLSGTKAGQVQLTFYNIAPPPKVGRLNSERVIKTAFMGLPVLASRSGFTSWGVDIARQVGLTLIERMRGQQFICLSGEERLNWDVYTGKVESKQNRTN